MSKKVIKKTTKIKNKHLKKAHGGLAGNDLTAYLKRILIEEGKLK